MNIKSVSSATKKFKPSKRVLIGAAIVAVLAVLFLFAMVQQVKQDRRDKAVWAAQTAEFNDLKTKNPQLQARVTQLETQLQKTTIEKQVLCTQIKSYTQARATRTLVVLPVTANCP